MFLTWPCSMLPSLQLRSGPFRAVDEAERLSAVHPGLVPGQAQWERMRGVHGRILGTGPGDRP
jgi:hypothetical protein